MLSVIIPAYNEELSVERAYRTISKILKEANIDNEILFIDDGSSDLTFEKIRNMAEKEAGLHGLHFSRNFGKEAAISAGLANAAGDCAVVIDCDLQHPPEKIVEMYRLWQKGYEVVEGVKSSRGTEGKMHGWAARSFYSIISSTVGFDMSNASDFKLLDRKVIDVLNAMPERNGFFRASSYWAGFNRTTVEFDVIDRAEGDSKWSKKSLVKYAVSNITSYSAAPMQFVTVLGLIMLAIACGLGVWAIVDAAVGRVLPQILLPTVIMLFIGSMVMISIGIVGYYIARIYDEIKARPKYIISSSCQSKKIYL